MKVVPDNAINTKAYYDESTTIVTDCNSNSITEVGTSSETVHCNPWDIELLCDYISQTVPKSIKKKQLESL